MASAQGVVPLGLAGQGLERQDEHALPLVRMRRVAWRVPVRDAIAAEQSHAARTAQTVRT